MSNIKIDDLKFEQIEKQELTDKEIQFILGGCNTSTETNLGNVAGNGEPITAEEFNSAGSG